MGAEVRIPLPAKTDLGGIEFMLPRGEQIVAETYGLSLPAGVAPKKLGLLANGFPEADVFLLKLADALRAHWPETEYRSEVKASFDQLNVGIREPLLTSMVEECDAVVIAWGHCGSCTSGVTRDGVSFTQRGVPNVTLICDIFWDYSAWLGKAMGTEGLPRVQVPFPLAGTSGDHQKAWAERIAPQVIAGLEGR